MKPLPIILLLSVFLFFSFAQNDFDAMAKKYGASKARFITPHQLNDWFNGAEEIYIFDIREKKEYLVSHIQGASYIGYDEFSFKKIEKDVPKTAKIVCYCSVGYRSAKISDQLIKKGYKNVFNLYGGIFNWVNKGFTVFDAEEKQTQKVHAYDKSWGKWLVKGEKIYE